MFPDHIVKLVFFVNVRFSFYAKAHCFHSGLTIIVQLLFAGKSGAFFAPTVALTVTAVVLLRVDPVSHLVGSRPLYRGRPVGWRGNQSQKLFNCDQKLYTGISDLFLTFLDARRCRNTA